MKKEYNKMDSQNKLIAEAIRQAGYTYVNCHINGTGGSVLPGKKAKEIFPDILKVTSDKLQTILISGTKGKKAKIQIHIPGEELIIERTSDTFENSITECVDAMKEKLTRAKEKKYDI